MNGLACNAWRDPWHVRLVRSVQRNPWGAVQTVTAYVVGFLAVVVTMFGIPLALLVMGGPA